MDLSQYHSVDPTWPEEPQAALEYLHRWRTLRDLHTIYDQNNREFSLLAERFPHWFNGYALNDIIQGAENLPLVFDDFDSDYCRIQIRICPECCRHLACVFFAPSSANQIHPFS